MQGEKLTGAALLKGRERGKKARLLIPVEEKGKKKVFSPIPTPAQKKQLKGRKPR